MCKELVANRFSKTLYRCIFHKLIHRHHVSRFKWPIIQIEPTTKQADDEDRVGERGGVRPRVGRARQMDEEDELDEHLADREAADRGEVCFHAS